MTCFEKYKQEHGGKEPDVLNQCPNGSGGINIGDPDYCTYGESGECFECWNREIPNTEPTDACFDEDGHTPIIKDSGKRREFPTGAVRDIAQGKGRCDLLPLDVLGAWTVDEILVSIHLYLSTGDTGFLEDAMEEFVDSEYGGNFYTAILEVAKHFEDGAVKYGDNNWQKGIYLHCYIDSAVRHYCKYRRGDKDEPHDRAFLWNLLCAIWTHKNKPEMIDIPGKEEWHESNTGTSNT